MTSPLPNRQRRGPFRAAAAALATALVLAACGGEDAATPAADLEAASDAAEPIFIVVTTAILGDVVANLVGDDGTVRVLVSAGVDPHGYQASAADGAAMRDADLVISNGLLLEEGLVSAIDAAEADGVRVLSIADKVDPIEFEFMGRGHSHDDDHDDDHGDDDKDDDHGHSHGHSHGDDDHDDDHGDDHGDDHDDDHGDHGDEGPHFWWDPMRMVMAVDLIAAELATLRPDIDWAARAAAYNAQAMAAHEQMVALFDTIPAANRRIITNHDSLGYLEYRYGFEVIGTVIPGSSTMAETNPRAFAELIDLVIAEGLFVIFAENTDSTVLASQLASQAVGRGGVDIEVVRIYTDSLGEPGSGADTYLTMLIRTSELITQALQAA